MENFLVIKKDTKLSRTQIMRIIGYTIDSLISDGTLEFLSPVEVAIPVDSLREEKLIEGSYRFVRDYAVPSEKLTAYCP